MSGGSFDHAYRTVSYMDVEILAKLKSDESDGISPEYRKLVEKFCELIHPFSSLLKDIEWHYSGDSLLDFDFVENLVKIGIDVVPFFTKGSVEYSQLESGTLYNTHKGLILYLVNCEDKEMFIRVSLGKNSKSLVFEDIKNRNFIKDVIAEVQRDYSNSQSNCFICYVDKINKFTNPKTVLLDTYHDLQAASIKFERAYNLFTRVCEILKIYTDD